MTHPSAPRLTDEELSELQRLYDAVNPIHSPFPWKPCHRDRGETFTANANGEWIGTFDGDDEDRLTCAAVNALPRLIQQSRAALASPPNPGWVEQAAELAKIAAGLEAVMDRVQSIERGREGCIGLAFADGTDHDFVGDAASRLHQIAALGPAQAGEGEGDDLYPQAVMFATRDKASTSYIQRRLGIGFNRAARLFERMQSEGLISSPNAAGARSILVPWTGTAPPSLADEGSE